MIKLPRDKIWSGVLENRSARKTIGTFEMRSSRIITIGLIRDTQSRRPCKHRDRLEGCSHKPSHTWSHQQREEAGKYFPLEPSEIA
jgi:hypothetical protein